MRLPFLLLLALAANSLFSQRVLVYPIKINHKWGFATAGGKVVVEPKYDAVGSGNLGWGGEASGSGNSGYRLVQVGERLGLLDNSLREVLPPTLRHVRPLNDSLFAVVLEPDLASLRQPSTIDNQQLTIVNRQGERMVEGQFEDVLLFEAAGRNVCKFIKVKKGGRWGVFSGSGRELLPAVFADVELCDVGEGFFKVKKEPSDTLWGLVNSRNRTLLPPKFRAVEAITENCFAALTARQGWEAWDSSGKRLLEPVWVKISPLNRHLAALQDAFGRWHIYSFHQKDTLSFSKQFTEFQALDEKYVVASKLILNWRQDSLAGRTLVLLDSLAREVKTPPLRRIRLAKDSIYYGLQRRWGLLTLKSGVVLPCDYDSIGAIENGLVFVFRFGMCGIVNENLKPLLPPMLERVVRQDSIIKGWEEDVLKVYKWCGGDSLIFMQEVENVRIIRVGGGGKNYVEAQPQPPGRRNELALPDDVSPPFTVVENTRFDWRLDEASRLFSLWERSPGGWSEVLPPFAQQVLHLNQPRLSLAYDPVGLPAEKTPIADLLGADTLHPFTLFLHQSGKMATQPAMLGLRGGDFKRGLPFAAFFDLEGKMGLVNKNGEQKLDKDGKPLRFAYVGQFFEGKARVCFEGKLAFAEETKEEKYGVVKARALAQQFGLRSNLGYSQIAPKFIILDSLGDRKPRWGFIDTLGNTFIEPSLDFANDYFGGEAVAQKNGAWGVLDQQGKAAIEFKYVSLRPFHGNWLVGEKAAMTLVFNQKGHERAIGNYRRQGNFSEGLCKVQVGRNEAASATNFATTAAAGGANATLASDTLWGFMDAEGKEKIACRFEEVRDFSGGLAAVRLGEKWNFVDTAGNFAFDLEAAAGGEVATVGDFHEGLAWFKTGYKYGYVNRRGEVKIQPQFTKAFDFQCGAARVAHNRRTGIIDTLGNFLLKPERFVRINDFNEWGVAQAFEKFPGGKIALVNAKGEVLTAAKFASAGEFREGYTVVGDGEFFGLVNRAGREILPLKFEAIGELSEGLVAVRSRQQPGWQFFDTLGKLAFKQNFDLVHQPFSHGMAVVQVNQFDPATKLVIDKTGAPLPFSGEVYFQFFSEGIFGFWNKAGVREGAKTLHFFFGDAACRNWFGQYFQEAKSFKNGVALVKNNNRWGALNRNGLPVVATKYPFLNQQDEGSIAVRLPVVFGVVDKKGKPIIQPGYDRIEWMEGNAGAVFRLELGEKIGYVRADGSWIWELRK